MKPSLVSTLAGLLAVGGSQNLPAQNTFSDDNWSALGLGMGPTALARPYVYALAVSGSDLYAGGWFTTVGGKTVNYVAKWNGSSWSALGSGMGGSSPAVYALAVSGTNLYAGGSFTTAGGNSANNVAKWNGSAWSALGSGMGGTIIAVYALAASGTNLYAGGRFTTAGGIIATNIAKWNGHYWSALGSGMGSIPGGAAPNVYALAVLGSDLYAGGWFTTAGGNMANYIAKWDGSSWSALSSGVGGYVYALAVVGGDLYAGGEFTRAGGAAASNIAKWDGSKWSALGSGIGSAMNGFPYAYALSVSGSELYVGGTFTNAGGLPATNIVKWNGSSWSALGSGVNAGLTALAVAGTDLYGGGQLTVAGGHVTANYIATARIGSIAKSVVVANSTTCIQFSGVTGYLYDVQRAACLDLPTAWTNLTASPLSPASDGTFAFTDTNAPPSMGYYRAVEH